MVNKRRKRGGTTTTVPPLQQYSFSCGNSASTEAACQQTNSNQSQTNMVNQLSGGKSKSNHDSWGDKIAKGISKNGNASWLQGGGGGCSLPSKISVVSFSSSNDVSPVNASSLALDNTTQLVQGASDAQGDNVPKSTIPSNVTMQNGGIKKYCSRRKSKRKRRGGNEWGCVSGGKRKGRKSKRKGRKSKRKGRKSRRRR